MKTRTFIALNLPSEIKKKIGKIIDELKRVRKGVNPVRSKTSLMSADLLKANRTSNGVKWVEPENIHLTLHFLGWLEEEKIKKVKKILEEASQKIKPCLIEIREIDCFPTKTSPRVIFLEGLEENNIINNLRTKIGEKLEAIGIETDKRPFRLHFTLGRVKEKGLRLPQIKIKSSLSFEVRSIELMKSELRPSGPIYSVLESFPFKS